MSFEEKMMDKITEALNLTGTTGTVKRRVMSTLLQSAMTWGYDEAKSESVWQPIKTAPKNTELLLWFSEAGAGSVVGQSDEDLGDGCRAKFWMQLPETPTN